MFLCGASVWHHFCSVSPLPPPTHPPLLSPLLSPLFLHLGSGSLSFHPPADAYYFFAVANFARQEVKVIQSDQDTSFQNGSSFSPFCEEWLLVFMPALASPSHAMMPTRLHPPVCAQWFAPFTSLPSPPLPSLLLFLSWQASLFFHVHSLGFNVSPSEPCSISPSSPCSLPLPLAPFTSSCAVLVSPWVGDCAAVMSVVIYTCCLHRCFALPRFVWVDCTAHSPRYCGFEIPRQPAICTAASHRFLALPVHTAGRPAGSHQRARRQSLAGGLTGWLTLACHLAGWHHLAGSRRCTGWLAGGVAPPRVVYLRSNPQEFLKASWGFMLDALPAIARLFICFLSRVPHIVPPCPCSLCLSLPTPSAGACVSLLSPDGSPTSCFSVSELRQPAEPHAEFLLCC